MVIRVIAGTTGVDDFDDLAVSVAIWDSARPFRLVSLVTCAVKNR
jgi:hypothetical protein